MKRIFQLFFFLFLFSSCTQDIVQPVPATGDLVTIGFHISVAGIPSVMPATRGTGIGKHGAISVGYDLREAVATRSDAARTEAEKALKSLWVLQFEGTATGSALIKKEDIAAGVHEGFAEVTLLANNAKNRVYLVANADVSAFSVGGTTLQNFEEGILTFAPCTEAKLAERGLPMIAWADIDPRTDDPGTLMLQSMVTRLTLQCKVAQGLDCSIQSVTQNQVSEKVSVTPLAADDAAVRPATVTAADFTKSLEISGADKTATMVCYFPGNLAGRKTGLTEMWERTTANAPAEKAAYLQITGKTPTGKLCFYTFYLGDGSATDFNVVGNRHYKLALTLQSADETDLRVETYADLNVALNNRTANCYMVTANAKGYAFDATVMGNGATTLAGSFPNSYDIVPQPLAPQSVKVLWETGTVAGAVVSKVQLSPDKTKVLFKTGTDAGNAVIAVYDNVNPDDAGAKILWSWHVWKPADAVADLEVQKYADNNNPPTTVNFFMMDRNLGATVATAGADGALGLLYQWGRKDPFPGAKDKNTSEYMATVPSLATGGQLNNTTTPGTDVSLADNAACLAYATGHPTTFFKYNSSWRFDWIKDKQDNLWGNPWEGEKQIYSNSSATVNSGYGSKSIYDPCPVGYRVAPQDTWTALKKADGSQYGDGTDDPQSMWDGTNKVWSSTSMSPAGSVVSFPASGYVSSSDGTLDNVGYDGFYWCSSAYNETNDNAGGFSFDNNGFLYPVRGDKRTNGYPVRCFQEL